MPVTGSRTFYPLALAAILLVCSLADVRGDDQSQGAARSTAPHAASPTNAFKTSDECMACHNSLQTSSGEDISIGSNWRASIMANSSRDPYWQASVRRETLDHPSAANAIQDECSICHMPMARTEARFQGREGEVFSHLPVGSGASHESLLAYDGVSCTICHQITGDKLGTPESFTGGYVIAPPPAGGKPTEPRSLFGPFQIEKGLTTVMHSSSEFKPAEAAHVRQSELCATCHTLITKALGPGGEVIGELPEQVMYLEWRHSAYVGEEKSCQSCHMPAVQESTPIASVLGQPREGMARHQFVGGNSFMLRMLNRYRLELGVAASSAELDASIKRTVDNLQTSTARVSIDNLSVAGGRATFDVSVQNLTGHKLPTAYPSRRAWLHVTLKDRTGRVLFESGAIDAKGQIAGNDADADGAKFEPHYTDIGSSGEVQIYESVMANSAGAPTTGLLQAVRYLKDNRLLPRGFDKNSADKNIAVVGSAATDDNFSGGSDRVRYSVEVGPLDGPVEAVVELRFQSIGYRWAQNLADYQSDESARFAGYYNNLSSVSSEVLATASAASR
jgi:hypothetical protein